MVGVSAENRAAAGVKGGDEIDVDLELDTAPREIIVPDDLNAALDVVPEARADVRRALLQQQVVARPSGDRGQDRGDTRPGGSRSPSKLSKRVASAETPATVSQGSLRVA